MDHLYETIKKEMGIPRQERTETAENVQEVQAAQPPGFPAGARENSDQETPSCEPPSREVSIRRVQFPVKTDQLFCLRTADMSREQCHALEQYRVLRSRVIELMRNHRVRSLMLTSALATEQKTTVSINLALAISQVQGVRVCLVDADMRKAGVAEVLGITSDKGLQDLLHGAARLNEAMLQLTDNLFLIPSSNTDLSSAEALQSASMVSLVQTLRESFEIVIFDTPPLFPVADARILANMVDGVLLCVRSGKTSELVVQEAVELIRPRLLGTVLVDAQVRTSPYYYYDPRPDIQK